MCSVLEGEEDIVRSKPLVNPRDISDRNCMKCVIQPAVTIARTKDPFCKDCFEVYFTHRFRATFGRAKLVRQGEEVLVAFSGGLSSRVLLHLIEKGLSKDMHKQLRFVPSVVYINESAVVGTVDHELSSKILSIASSAPFPLYYTQLDEILGSNKVWSLRDLMRNGGYTPDLTAANETGLEQIESVATSCDASNTSVQDDNSSFSSDAILKELQTVCNNNIDSVVRLSELFNELQSVTSKEDLLLSLRRQLLVNVAKQLGISKVLVGDNATSLSVQLFTQISQGRGGTLPLDIGFCDDRTEVAILRPLREFPVSEVTSYIELNQLETIDTPNVLTKLPTDNSIGILTGRFLATLQSDFPSTTSTIFRTGDKLKINNELIAQTDVKCPLCQVPCGVSMDEEIFSHVASETDDVMWNRLCYGCRVTLRDARSRKNTTVSLFGNLK